MNKLFDLRFVIGIFFLVIGLLLLLYHFISGDNNVGETSNVNLWCGITFTIFGVVMLLLSGYKK